MKLLVLVNHRDSGPRRLVEWALDEGVSLDLRPAWAGGVPTFTDASVYDGIVLLGGQYLPQETDRAPWLSPEADLVRSAIDAELPVLGICLGGQLIAHVMGGTVKGAHGEPEQGATAITVSADATGDPLFGELVGERFVLENHVDQITALPETALLLASSPGTPHQAFRIGSAWGTQFHPESDAGAIRRWDAERLRALGFDKDQLITRADVVEADMLEDAHRLFRGFFRVATERLQG